MINPTNQKQQVLHYLYFNESITLKYVINDSMFFKMQTRLNDIELEHGEITHKDRVKFINKFGRKSTFLKYSKSITDQRLIELFKIYA